MEHNGVLGSAIIVTGAAGGIGAAVSAYLARLGARVVLADRDSKAAEALAESLRADGLTAEAQGVDVTSWSSCQQLVDACVTGHGRLDGLVNLAGMMYLRAPGKKRMAIGRGGCWRSTCWGPTRWVFLRSGRCNASAQAPLST